MSGTSAPRTDTGLLERLRELHPLIRSHAARAERQRRVPEEVADALTGAGVLRMNVPRHYGGYQTPLRTQIDALSEVSAACGSAGYTAMIQAGSAFVAALFSDEAQDEMFTGPDVRIGGTLIPGSKAVPAPGGGYTVSGKSPFSTGCRHADWHLLTALADTGDGPPELLWLAIPMAELDVLDDWDVTGLAGSGSNTVVARDVRVPAHRVLPVGPMLDGAYPSQRSNTDPFYRMPVLLLFCAWTAASALGLGRAALAEFRESIHRRGITYSFYERQYEAAATHLQFAEAELKVSAAELLTADLVAIIESRAADDKPWTVEERVRIRAQAGYLARLCKEAGDLIGSASGASSLHREAPVQRIVRDLNALNLHSFVNPATNLELYGRVLSGLEPGTPFV
ncbi:acyl-CoA dehydrogenase family protein [Streptomyces sp. NPDC003691]